MAANLYNVNDGYISNSNTKIEQKEQTGKYVLYCSASVSQIHRYPKKNTKKTSK